VTGKNTTDLGFNEKRTIFFVRFVPNLEYFNISS